MDDQPPRARGGRRPFGAQISDEQPPSSRGPFGAPALPGIGGEVLGPAVARAASDAVHDRLEPTRMRFESMSSRRRGALLLGGGALVTCLMWVLASVGGFDDLAPRVSTLLLVPLVVGPAVLAYGVMTLLSPAPPPPPADDRFGSVLAEARAQVLWKMRLGAVAVGIVHVMIFKGVT